MLTVVPDPDAGDNARLADGSPALIDEIVREGARRMLAEALKAEVDAYIAAFADQRDEHGHRLVVRNGHHQPREVLTSAGAIEVTAPRVNDKRTDPDTGQRKRFSSAILPAWARKTPEGHRGAAAAVPARPVQRRLRARTGPVPRLGRRAVRAGDHEADRAVEGRTTRLRRTRSVRCGLCLPVGGVYLWADGIHVNIRLEEHKLCLLVMIGVRADGRKELVALTDGYRESVESWADLLRDCKRRGMGAPVLAAGDGALGFWGALREVFPDTREQRCWFHKIANVLAALPKSAHPGAKNALSEIWNAEDRRHALDAVAAFEAAYGARFPKAVAKITDDIEVLLAFYDYPAQHWIHLRTTNPIESTFATVRHRTKVTKGPGSRAAGLAMAFKLIESAQARWRAVNAPHLVALVRAGALFVNGQLVERPDDQSPPSAA